MQTVYYINGRPSAYTWKQVLYWCYESIAEVTWRHSRIRNKYGYFPGSKWSCGRELEELTGKEHVAVDIFFSKFRHNPNDGTWTRGRWKQNYHYEYIQQKDENGRLTSEWIKTTIFDDWIWIEPVFTPNSYQITDSHGRIIPSGIIKADYLKYTPDQNDRKREPRRRYHSRWGSRSDHNWEFRRDPVPCLRSYKRKGWWHKYAGDHCGFVPWKRSWYAIEVDSKEIYEEYGVRIKNQKIIPYTHDHSKGRGWKRTRKEKQWMKADWKKLYEVPYEDIG